MKLLSTPHFLEPWRLKEGPGDAAFRIGVSESAAVEVLAVLTLRGSRRVVGGPSKLNESGL